MLLEKEPKEVQDLLAQKDLFCDKEQVLMAFNDQNDPGKTQYLAFMLKMCPDDWNRLHLLRFRQMSEAYFAILHLVVTFGLFSSKRAVL